MLPPRQVLEVMARLDGRARRVGHGTDGGTTIAVPEPREHHLERPWPVPAGEAGPTKGEQVTGRDQLVGKAALLMVLNLAMPSEPHDHEHGERCGHVQVRHHDHVDYLHDEHVHRPHGDHYDECASSGHQPAEEHIHVAGEGCGHAPVLHGDHLDYVHDGHRHAAHEGHCDEH